MSDRSNFFQGFPIFLFCFYSVSSSPLVAINETLSFEQAEEDLNKIFQAFQSLDRHVLALLYRLIAPNHPLFPEFVQRLEGLLREKERNTMPDHPSEQPHFSSNYPQFCENIIYRFRKE